MTKFLDYNGLSLVISTLKGKISTAESTATAAGKTAAANVQTNLTTHINDTNNPHKVTAAQVGLGNVTNESKATMFTSPNFTGTPTAPTATSASTSTAQIATTAFVQAAIGSAQTQALVFKGSVGTDPTKLPDAPKVGDVYVVDKAGSFAGETCEIGDTIICKVAATKTVAAQWVVIQKNIDGAVTSKGLTNGMFVIGNGQTVSSYTGTVGTAYKPVFMEAGTLKPTTYELNKTVPGDAIFTDTKYAIGGTSGSDSFTFSENETVKTTFTINNVGHAGNADSLTSNGGSATQPIYFSGGKPKECTYLLNKTVPADAIFTKMTGSTATAAGSMGYVPTPQIGDNLKFLRGDGTWVVPENTKYGVMTGASASANGASGLVPAPSKGQQFYILRGDGAWVSVNNGASGNFTIGTNTVSIGKPATAGTADKVANPLTITPYLKHGETTPSVGSVVKYNGSGAVDLTAITEDEITAMLNA